MLDELALIAISFLAGSGLMAVLLKTLPVYKGEEPSYIEGRGDRSPHVHHYDTMDAATNGKFVCGTCRKAKK